VADSTKSDTASVAVNNPQPTLTSISPATVGVGSGDLAITVSGSGFNPLSVAQLAGTNLSTSFLSSSQLTAQIAASLLTAEGTFGVTVSNPAPGGGTSNQENFVVSAPTPPSATTLVSGPSPFPPGCEQAPQGTSINYQNAEVEPYLVIDPWDSAHLVAVWQQDRWNNGGAHSLMTGVSRDGGQTWQHSFAAISRCAGGDAATGYAYDRASDPWITISPNGWLYQISLSFDAHFPFAQALLVTPSSDGGDTWGSGINVEFYESPGVVLDKPSITADPQQSSLVYVTWVRYIYTDQTESVLAEGPTWFTRTTDGGLTWELPRIIHSPPGGQAPVQADVGSYIVVLADGTLVDIFLQYTDTPLWPPPDAKLLVIRSSDHGVTWSPPIEIDVAYNIGITDVETGEAVRDGSHSFAVDASTGALYLVWEDARFSGLLRDGIAFSTSTDGGLTWSPAVQVNQAPNVQAFAPSIAVGQNGKIAINYYDFRMDTSDPNTLLTTYWQITSQDGGQTWQEIPLSSPFDLRTAPMTSYGYMVTDYEGLVPMGDSFYSLFVATNFGNTSNPTDIFGVSSAAVTSLAQLQTMNNGRVEINPHPRTARELIRLRLERPRTSPPE